MRGLVRQPSVEHHRVPEPQLHLRRGWQRQHLRGRFAAVQQPQSPRFNPEGREHAKLSVQRPGTAGQGQWRRWQWNRDPFGTLPENSNPESIGTFTFALRFPGQMFDGQAGLHQNWHRDYSPAIGRYVESDPIGLRGGTNTYAYAHSSPVFLSDFLGLIVRCIELYSLRDYEKKEWSTIKTWASNEYLTLGNGPASLSSGANLHTPTPRFPRGGISPGIEAVLYLWYARDVTTRGSEGYSLRSFRTVTEECRDDDPCRDPRPTLRIVKKDYTPWHSVTTRDVDETRTERLRRYGQIPIQIPLPGLPVLRP